MPRMQDALQRAFSCELMCPTLLAETMTGPGLTLTGNETLAELTTSLEFLRCEREMSVGNELRHRALSEQINTICDLIIDKQLAR